MEPHETGGAAPRETRIRHRAYMLWLAEGRPELRAEEHWRLASEAEVESGHAEAANSREPPDATPSTNS